MRLMRFLLRLAGFVQWLAAMAIGAWCAAAHIHFLEGASGTTAAGSWEEVAIAFAPTMVSVQQTLPALLLAVLLMLSGIYCDQVGRSVSRPRLTATGGDW